MQGLVHSYCHGGMWCVCEMDRGEEGEGQFMLLSGPDRAILFGSPTLRYVTVESQ